MRRTARIVIAGGGVAALETLLALRSLAGNRLEFTVISPQSRFTYRPVTIAEAFDRATAASYSLHEIVGARGTDRLIADSLAEVDAPERLAITARGQKIQFDELVIAIGAKPLDPFPGALTFRGRADVPALRDLLDDLSANRCRSVAVALPSARMWPLPAYELALLIAAHLRDDSASIARVSVVTPEDHPLELFGSPATEAVSALLSARGVAVHASSLPSRLGERSLVLAGGAELFVDRVITLPILEGRRIPGIPCDRDGFIPVDRHGRVGDLDGVYAAGDATSYPLKQGGLAAQAADAVAELIASRAGIPITPAPFRPVLRGLLMTGGAPLYLRAAARGGARPPADPTAAGQQGVGGRHASTASHQALWWPPAKIAGRHLAPYLAAGSSRLPAAERLTDRQPIPGPRASESEYSEALELALMLADGDARWGDYPSALTALEAAEAIHGALPYGYEAKRRRWREAARTG
jgi:sulfide:quinone oxidoreductase